jgi:nucleotide-binding universal stress UspA family protein
MRVERSCTLLVVEVDSVGMTETDEVGRQEIVVGLDGGVSSAEALRWAAEHSTATGLPLRVVHVWQLSALGAAAVSAGAGDLLQAGTEDARARATRFVLDALGGDSAKVRWSLEIVEGAPGLILVDRSATARLLVIGTREHTGLRRMVAGSVSHYCLSHAAVPVVAVPPPRGAAASTGHGGMSATPPLL